MSKRSIPSRFRIYHRYLGFFLAGIMAMYAMSGIIMIFRTTDFLKIEKTVERELQPNMPKEELGRALFIRDFKITEETESEIKFNQGIYNKNSGMATYNVKELPTILQKIEGVHKATTNSPLFFLNIFFGVSLLFFAVSAFFMFVTKSKSYKKGIYFAIGGFILVLIMVLV